MTKLRTNPEVNLFIGDSTNMKHIKDSSVDLIITSPPYFNVKDYSMDGVQETKHSSRKRKDIGAQNSFDKYIDLMNRVWNECFRVLKPNGKLCINVPLMPMIKKDYSTHYNRHIFDLQSEIQSDILKNTDFHLMDLYIWNRTNSTKKLMFGSYPNPGNLYAQNTIEFITVYVKDGKSVDKRSKEEKESSKLTQKEWTTFTKQIWDIPIPNKKDAAFGKHSAIMPEEIPRRLIKMFSFEGDVVMDPFTGSGTTLKVAKELNRNACGYELYDHYADLINEKVGGVNVVK